MYNLHYKRAWFTRLYNKIVLSVLFVCFAFIILKKRGGGYIFKTIIFFLL